MPSNPEPTEVRIDRYGLTEAEWEIAVILHEGCWCESERDDYEGCGPQSRGADAKRAIAAVRPIIAAEALRSARKSITEHKERLRANRNRLDQRFQGRISGLEEAAGLCTTEIKALNAEETLR
jgi:hypothetical protein